MATTTTIGEQLDRLYQLCGVLQDYKESVTRLEDAKRQDDARQHLWHARQAGLLVGGDQDAGQDERDAIQTRDMVRRLDAALENWTPLVNEFFRLAILNRLDIMSPALGQIETTRRMPHRIGSFDWQAFSHELRAVRHEVLRLMDTPAEGGEAEQYVTLDQIAALVNKSKRTLESRKSRKKNPLPFADVDGGGGKADEWLYDTIRPWLESEFGKSLPKRMPDNLRRADRI